MRALALSVFRGQAETYLLGTFVAEIETAWLLFLVWCCASVFGRGFDYLTAAAVFCSAALAILTAFSLLLFWKKISICIRMSAVWMVSPLLVALAISRYSLLKYDFYQWDRAEFEVWYLEATCPLPYRQRQLEVA